MERTVMIRVKDLSAGYGEKIILDHVSFRVYEGEIFVILGGSGCGKSTLLKTIIGLIEPCSGRITIDGQQVLANDETTMQTVFRKIGVLYQSAALLGSMTVAENVALPIREYTSLPEEAVDLLVRMKLGLVNLEGYEDHLPSELSGGMKKRVGLARAIVMDPQVVLYDEPTTGLDPIMADVINTLIRDLQRELSITSVVVTHDIRSAYKVADRMTMLHEGRMIYSGTPEETRETDNEIVRQFIEGRADGPVRAV